jgi:pimeloyl-ACP methyl ester carboxylesterase
VLVPGLGALGYLLPTMRALAARGVRCTLLDLPGFGTSRARPGAPTVGSVGEWAAAWIRTVAPPGRLVLAGHSTGGQGALLAALRVQRERPLAAVVLAGPTVAPSQRSLARLVAAGPAAYRRDSVRELVVAPDLLRANRQLVTMLRSATADRPEASIASIRGPVVVTAGRRDAFAPASWLATLAGSAASAERVHAVQLPGSHNNPYTHPDALASLVVAAGRGADG